MIHKLLGFLILLTSLALVFLFEASATFSGAFRIFHWPAVVLTALGPIGIVLMCNEWSLIKSSVKHFFSSNPKALTMQNQFEANLMHQVTHQIYRIGTKALDRPLQQEKLSQTLRRVFRRLTARVPLLDIIDLVEKERERVYGEMQREIRVVGIGLRMAPSVGMLGTILGMVQLLAHLQDPSNIGAHMSLALLTTFYGLFFSLVLWNPIQNHFESVLDIRMRGFDQLIHWLEIMEERKPIQYFEDNIRGDEGKIKEGSESETTKALGNPVLPKIKPAAQPPSPFN